MVKNFEEFINEKTLITEIESAIETPDCLLKIVDFINQKTLIPDKSKDGRVGSIKDEDNCIELLKTSNEWNVIENENGEYYDKMTIIVPKIRYWYDFEVVDNNKHYYVNIKSSSFKSNDNIGGPEILLYGLFGKKVNLEGKKKSEKYAILYNEYNKHEETGYDDVKDFNYYFLIINKNNKSGSFITSLNHMNADSIISNGSNLPFQCKWSKVSHSIVMSKSKIADMLMDVTFHSLVKSIDIFETEPMKKYMDKHKKKTSIPLWED